MLFSSWISGQNSLFPSSEYKEFLRFKTAQQASSSSATATVAHTGNSTVCLSHFQSLGPWILDSGPSDHISGNLSLLYRLSPPKTPHTDTYAEGSKTHATGVGKASPLPTLPLNSVLFGHGCPFDLMMLGNSLMII